MDDAPPATPLHRDSARVVVLDPDGQVLLFEVVNEDPSGPAIWITPGGGIEDGEAPRSAAARELAEETGLRVGDDELVGPIARTEGAWTFRGTPLEGVDWFFALATEALEVSTHGWTDLEHEIHRGWRWWSIEELEETDAVVFPKGLAELVRTFANGWHPEREPVELPWFAL